VIIQGAAGIGKSRLLREFQRLLAADTAAHEGIAAATSGQAAPAWLDCRTDEILRQPLNPFRYLLAHYFNQSSTHDVAHNQQQFAQKLDHLISALTDPTLAAELARLRPVLAALIDLPWEDPFYQQLEPELRLENTLEALKTFIKAESCCHPLIIRIEDAQWLDKESTLFLEKLVHNIEAYPLLLLITARPPSTIDPQSTTAPTEGSDDDILPTYRLRTVLRLQPLAKHDLRVLVSSWLEGEITQELLDLLDEQAKGNPLFIEQMVRYWQEQGFLQWG
jgi:predicted ATPase